jgi:predicted RND superfamily exporter protein
MRERAMHDRITHFFADGSRWLAVVCLCSAALPLYWIRHARIDNSIEVWIGTTGDEYSTYKSFLDKYGNEEFIVIAAEAPDPLSQDVLDFQKDLADRLRQIGEVDTVLDITEAASLFVRYKPDWKDLLHSNEFFANLLLGQDGRTFGLIVWLRKIDNPPERKIAVEKIESAVTAVASGKMNVHLAGTPLLNVALDRGSRNASRRFLPVALAVSVAVLALALRRVAGVIAVMCAVAVTTAWTVGLMVLAGKTFNMVTVALPSLLIILSLSGGIHITSRFQSLLARHADGGPAETDVRRAALHDALKEVLPPLFVSNVTTAVGFGSLMISDMQPVVDFGQFAALGMLLSPLFNVTIVPGILSWRPSHLWLRGELTASPAPCHWTAGIGRAVASREVWVLTSAGIIFAVCILLMTKIRPESNVLKFFPDDSKISRDCQFIAEKLTGLYTIELDASTEPRDGSTLLKQIEHLGKTLAARPEVAKVIHYQNIAASLEALPRPAFVPAAVASQNPLNLLLRKYRHSDDNGFSLRMSILVRAMASTDFYTLIDFTKQQAEQIITRPATCTLTGVVPLLNSAQHSLVNTQIRSFATAAGTVLILIGLSFRSVKAFIAALLPNLLPIISIFAIMVLLDIPLDAATVMIASVAIGIADDDTIHFLSCFRREKRAGRDTLDAVHNSFQNAGRAITFTSIVSASGFAILLLAEFRPIQYFGLLTGVTMITGWMGDVFVLPACVASLNLWGRQEVQGVTP